MFISLVQLIFRREQLVLQDTKNIVFLGPEATKTLVHAFVGSRLDYCNSVLVGVSGQLLRKLQVIQNAAACIITGTKKYERMKPVLQELDWLPVRQRITYKTALLMYRSKCIHGLATSYLAACCQPTSHCAGCSKPPVHQPAAAAGSTNEDMLRRSEFPGQRSRCVEQSAGCATFTRHVTGHI